MEYFHRHLPANRFARTGSLFAIAVAVTKEGYRH